MSKGEMSRNRDFLTLSCVICFYVTDAFSTSSTSYPQSFIKFGTLDICQTSNLQIPVAELAKLMITLALVVQWSSKFAWDMSYMHLTHWSTQKYAVWRVSRNRDFLSREQIWVNFAPDWNHNLWQPYEALLHNKNFIVDQFSSQLQCLAVLERFWPKN